MKHNHRHNPKIIALIVETILFVIGIIILMILEGVGINVTMWPKLIITGVYLFALALNLSLIKYDAMRDIRSEFKNTNLPLYTDETSMICHDLIDEKQNKKYE